MPMPSCNQQEPVTRASAGQPVEMRARSPAHRANEPVAFRSAERRLLAPLPLPMAPRLTRKPTDSQQPTKLRTMMTKEMRATVTIRWRMVSPGTT